MIQPDLSLPDRHGVSYHTIHGLITVQLTNAPKDALTSLVADLGPSRGTPSSEPDVCITFVDKIATTGSLRHQELNGAAFAFDDDNFYLLDGEHLMRIDVRQVGQRCEILCEHGVRDLSLVLPIIGMRLLQKRQVLLHSSSFVYKDRGILVTGWQTGGKSEMLLAFMAAGARYFSDEWTIMSAEERTLAGLSGKVSLWNWQLKQLPQYWSRLASADRRRVRLVRLCRGLHKALRAVGGHGGPLASPWKALGTKLKYSGRVASAPEKLFGMQVQHEPTPIARVFLASVSQGEPTRVLPLETREIADRMVASQAYERLQLRKLYDQSQYAFPDRRNNLIECSQELEHHLILQALDGTPAYEVRHPYPLRLQDLFEAAAPVC